jgi:archaellum component FlaG (FlaF/FlaG flagellin family)
LSESSLPPSAVLVDADKPRRGRWPRRLRIVAVVSTAVALLAGGVVAGWWGRDRFGTHETNITVQRPITVSEGQTQAASAMPNVLGLGRDSARQALADAGVNLSTVKIREQAYAGLPGVVIDQNPPAAASLPSGAATLTLSAPGTMPKLVGLALDAARSELSQMGATVLVQTRYQAGAAEGSILETDPASGQPLAERVKLVIAEPASSVFLDQLNAINSSCSSNSVYVAGVQRQHSLVCEPGQDSPAQMEYVLNRRVTTFQAVVGIGDTGASDTPVSFRIFVDGRLAFSTTLPFGSSKPVSIPVVGALRVRMVASVSKTGPSGSQVEAVFGNARFLGGSSAIDQLTAEAHP